MRNRKTLSAEYFENIYRADPDPWKFASSPYEASKYAATMAALPKVRYARGFEIGCSIGVLTEQLATRCDHLLAVDVAAEPLQQAMTRCRDWPGVEFRRMFVPEQWPEGLFDLIVLSEVVYYLAIEDVNRLAAKVIDSTVSGANVILVHWTEGTDYPLSGDAAADAFIQQFLADGELNFSDRHSSFRLDCLVRR